MPSFFTDRLLFEMPVRSEPKKGEDYRWAFFEMGVLSEPINLKLQQDICINLKGLLFTF